MLSSPLFFSFVKDVKNIKKWRKLFLFIAFPKSLWYVSSCLEQINRVVDRQLCARFTRHFFSSWFCCNFSRFLRCYKAALANPKKRGDSFFEVLYISIRCYLVCLDQWFSTSYGLCSFLETPTLNTSGSLLSNKFFCRYFIRGGYRRLLVLSG